MSTDEAEAQAEAEAEAEADQAEAEAEANQAPLEAVKEDEEALRQARPSTSSGRAP